MVADVEEGGTGVRAFVRGFQIGGTLSRYSGLPFTITSPSALNAPGQSQSADQVKPNVAILGGHDPNTPYFDGTAFVALRSHLGWDTGPILL